MFHPSPGHEMQHFSFAWLLRVWSGASFSSVSFRRATGALLRTQLCQLEGLTGLLPLLQSNQAAGTPMVGVWPTWVLSQQPQFCICSDHETIKIYEANQGNQTWAMGGFTKTSQIIMLLNSKQPICQIQSFLGPFLRPFLGRELVPLSIPATKKTQEDNSNVKNVCVVLS